MSEMTPLLDAENHPFLCSLGVNISDKKVRSIVAYDTPEGWQTKLSLVEEQNNLNNKKIPQNAFTILQAFLKKKSKKNIK